jgi:hypothetical protein
MKGTEPLKILIRNLKISVENSLTNEIKLKKSLIEKFSPGFVDFIPFH